VAVDARLASPVGLSTAVRGRRSGLYVADSQDHRVRRIDLGPATVAGNQPPTVDAGADYSVTATSPAGALVGLYATAQDPDGDPLTFAWSGRSER